VPSILILNKIDKMRSKRALLDLVKTLTCNNLALEEGRRKKPVKETPPQDKNREMEKVDEGGWPDFKGVFMVSSLNGDGVEKVVDFIESQAIVNPWEYKNNETTDQTPAQIIEQCVRARLLDFLPQVRTFKQIVDLF
jgi:GTPase